MRPNSSQSSSAYSANPTSRPYTCAPWRRSASCTRSPLSDAVPSRQWGCSLNRTCICASLVVLLHLGVVNEKINLAAKLALIEKPYEPGIVGFINDYKLQVVKVKGPFVWHKHDDTDDFFLVS